MSIPPNNFPPNNFPPEMPPGGYYSAPPPRPSGVSGWKIAGFGCLGLFLLAAIGGFLFVRSVQNNMSHPSKNNFVGIGVTIGNAEDDGEKLSEAIAVYHTQHGKYPQTLADLVAAGNIDKKTPPARFRRQRGPRASLLDIHAAPRRRTGKHTDLDGTVRYHAEQPRRRQQGHGEPQRQKPRRLIPCRFAASITVTETRHWKCQAKSTQSHSVTGDVGTGDVRDIPSPGGGFVHF